MDRTLKVMKLHLIQQYLDEPVRNIPMKIAVTDGKSSINYHDLSVFSNKLAHCLIASGVSRQDRVVFYMKRSVNCLVAILGILKADAIYVPIDHKTPYERWKKIIEDCKPSAILCDISTIIQISQRLKDLDTKIPVISLDSKNSLQHENNSVSLFCEDIYTFSNSPREYRNSDKDIAYILYTSGSTGNPKGVVISHENIKVYIDWAVECFDIGEKDKILGTAPFHFDMSTFDIYCTFKAGATLCIAADELLLFPENLVKFIECEKVTIWKGVSSLLMYLSRTGAIQKDRMPNLKTILFGGETLPTKYLIEWMKAYPDKRFYNVYGPTEATGISLYYYIDKVPETTCERIPIGKPCKDTEILLLNEDNSPTKPGEVGELCIAGLGLSEGYLNDNERTAQSFIPNPFSGYCYQRIYKTGDLARMKSDSNYEFLGRKDNQVKYMGYRIELCEIEQALTSINGINDAVVILAESEKIGLNELIAFYESDSSIPTEAIMSKIMKQLPSYMIPKRLFRIKQIPRCGRGKINRGKLYDVFCSYNKDLS